MKKMVFVILLTLLLVACGSEEMQSYEVIENETANQDTVNMVIKTSKTDESTVKKIGIDAVSQLDHNKVNGARITFLDSENNKMFAEAKIGFNQTGLNATGSTKENIFEISMK